MSNSFDTFESVDFDLAPVVLFVFNRPFHTKKTIEALKKNYLSSSTDLIIYSDAADGVGCVSEVDKVRDYIRGLEGFKSIKIIEREVNLGLANNILSGVTEVVNDYGKIIVLEDDLVVSKAFLLYMNKALAFYGSASNVWHISGWSYPIKFDGLGDAFLWRVMNCWGWATWAEKWACFEKNPNRLIDNWSSETKSRFDLDDAGVFWSQVTDNSSRKIDTWAIFWYSTIFENNGLCLSPTQTFVNNIGYDGSGINCVRTNSFSDKDLTLCEDLNINYPRDFKESEVAVKLIKSYYRKMKNRFFFRFLNKVSRLLFG